MVDLCWIADMVNKMLSNYFQIFQELKEIDLNTKDNGG